MDYYKVYKVLYHEKPIDFHLGSVYSGCNLERRRNKMSEQKLREFKLTKLRGFLKSCESNSRVLAKFLQDGCIQGVFDEYGNVGSHPDYDCSDVYIWEHELEFFEEVFEDQPKGFIPTLNEVCEVSRADDLETWFKFIPRAKYTPHYMNSECYVGDIQSEDVSWKVYQINVEHFVFRPIKKKTWQEQVESEFGFEHSSKNENFYMKKNTLSEDGLIKMAKRIIELSEKNNKEISSATEDEVSSNLFEKYKLPL